MTRSNWSLFSSRADCIGYVIDGANYDRFAESKKNLMKFLEQNRFMR